MIDPTPLTLQDSIGRIRLYLPYDRTHRQCNRAASPLASHLLATALRDAMACLEHLHLQAASCTDIDFVRRRHDRFLLSLASYAVSVGRNPLRRKELETTETEERAMAAPARTGLMSTPSNGYSTPAATGIKMTL